MGRVSGAYKPFRLMHVNACCKVAVEVGRTDVKLAHVHAGDSGYGEEDSNGVMFDDWAEYFSVVDSMNLAISFCHEAGFVFINGAC